MYVTSCLIARVSCVIQVLCQDGLLKIWNTKWVSGKVSFGVNTVDQCEAYLTLKSLYFKIHGSPVLDYWPISFYFQLSCQDLLQSSSPPCVIFQLSWKNCTSRALSWLLSTLLCNQLMKTRKLPRNKSSGLCLSRKQKGKALPVNWDKNSDNVISCWVLTYIRKL